MLDSRKLTAQEKLYDKVQEYVNLAKGIVTDDMDVEARYKALAGLYKHIDNENGGYIDPIRNAPNVDGVTPKEVGSEEHSTGNALSRFIKYAKEKFHEIRLKSVDGNGVEHYAFGLDWHPQQGFEEARELLLMLLTVIGYDGEFYWKQVKIRTGNELPKFWEGREKTISEIKHEIRETDGKVDDGIAKLGDDIRNWYFDIGPASIGLNDLNTKLQREFEESKEKQQSIIDKLGDEVQTDMEEAKQKAKEVFPVCFAGVASNGRPIIKYSDDIEIIQEARKTKTMIHKMTREEELELIQEMEKEDLSWTPQSGKKDSRQGLFNSVGNYIDDIADYLRKANNSISFDDEIIAFRALRNILAEMIHDNGGYALNDIKIDPLLEDMCYSNEKDYGFRELLDFVQNRMDGGIDVWWVMKNKDGKTNGEIVFTLLLHELATDVALRFRKLQRTGKLTEEDKKPLWEPIAGITFEDKQNDLQEKKKTDDRQKGNGSPEPISHLLIDGTKAKTLYKALISTDVDWLVDKDKYDENIFINRLTSIPSGEKIILHQLNQVNYITKKVLFHDKARMAPEEWDLIRQLFDAEDGEINRVDRASKPPKNHKTFNQYMGI